MHRAHGIHLCPLALTLALCTACSSAFTVKSEGIEPHGLPFYLKSMVYRHHTTYEYSWVRLSLSQAPISRTVAGIETPGPRTTRVRDVLESTDNRRKIDDLQRLVAGLPAKAVGELPGAILQIHAAFDSIARLPEDDSTPPSRASLRPTGNFIERVPVVDYTRIYYLNGKVPWFGSNSMSAELAADGTLSKGSAEASGGVGGAIDAISSALTGIAPIKEFLSSKWLPTKDDSAALTSDPKFGLLFGTTNFDPGTLSFHMEIALEQKFMTFDFTKDSPTPFSGGDLERVPVDFKTGTFTARRNDEATEKPAADGIGFSGTIRLPEPKKP